MATDMTVANTIAEQIMALDKNALWAWGSLQDKYDLVGDETSLKIRVRNCPKLKKKRSMYWVNITLNDLDLYDIELVQSYKVKNKEWGFFEDHVKTVEKIEGIYAENLVVAVNGLLG